jgi:hypothetical protein
MRAVAETRSGLRGYACPLRSAKSNPISMSSSFLHGQATTSISACDSAQVLKLLAGKSQPQRKALVTALVRLAHLATLRVFLRPLELSISLTPVAREGFMNSKACSL